MTNPPHKITQPIPPLKNICLTLRSIITLLMLGLLLTAGETLLTPLHVRSCHPGLVFRTGLILTDQNTGITINDDINPKIQKSKTILGQYQFRDRWPTEYGLVTNIFGCTRSELSIINKTNGKSVALSPIQMKEVRKQISLVYLNEGNTYLAQRILLPDKTIYWFDWNGLLINIYWIIVNTVIVIILITTIRFIKQKFNKEKYRTLAILANHCPNCGYDTRNLPQPRCPECGQTWQPINSITTHHHPY